MTASRREWTLPAMEEDEGAAIPDVVARVADLDARRDPIQQARARERHLRVVDA